MRAIARLFIFLIGMIGLTGFSNTATDQSQNSKSTFDEVEMTLDKVCVVEVTNEFVVNLQPSCFLLENTATEYFVLSNVNIHYDKFELKPYNYRKYYKGNKGINNSKAITANQRSPRDSLPMGIS